MKRLAVLAAVLFLAAAHPSWSQQGGAMGGMDTKDRQGMDMSKCKEMMDKGGTGMQGMEMPKECKEMMDKQGGAAKSKGAQPAPKKAAVQGKTHKGSGTVTKVDPAAGKVTIAHGAIETIKWPAMTMTFSVSDKALLDHVHQGGKVEFEFVQKGSDYVINKIH